MDERGYPGKRALDVALAGVAAVLASPLMLAVAIAIRLGSSGPVLYGGIRAGLHERPFRQYKFRSMVVGADHASFRTAPQGDARITRVGRFLRETSLDELPQLINVLRGEMSLVGPRPAALPQLEEYTADERRRRAAVRPGITGLSQVSGRSDLENAESLARDLDYAAAPSLVLDLAILARTVATVFGRRGTN